MRDCGLSSVGRLWVLKMMNLVRCHELSKDIFVKDADAFNDRMDIISSYKDPYKFVDAYKKELEEKYNGNEEEYSTVLYSKLTEFDNVIQKICEGLRFLDDYRENVLNQEKQVVVEDDATFDPDVETSACLRLYFQSPLYECLKIKYNAYCDDPNAIMPESVNEFIYRCTESKFFSCCDDLNSMILTENTYDHLKKNYLEIYTNVYYAVAHRFVNHKDLIAIDKRGAIFAASENKPVKQIDNIMQYISKEHDAVFRNISIELYKIKVLDKEGKYCIKIPIAMLGSTSEDEFDGPEEVRILYQRMLRGEKPSKYDYYFYHLGAQAKFTRLPNIDWIKEE